MFRILSDGALDLSPEQLSRAGIVTVPFSVSLDGEHYLKEGVELSVRDFYDALLRDSSLFPRTSMPSVSDYMDVFRPILLQGEDILCYTISSRLSGSFGAAKNAANLLRDEFPERSIVVVDSGLVTGLQGIFLLQMARYAREGHSLDETACRGEIVKGGGAIFFALDNLAYLTHGGRIGRLLEWARACAGRTPVLRFAAGELQPVGFCRGREEAIARIVALLEKEISRDRLNLNGYSFAFGWGADRADAEPLARAVGELFLEKFGRVPDFIPIQIGATIGVHVGPHPIGVGCIPIA